MIELSSYQNTYRSARLERDDRGILEVTLHSEGGPLVLDDTMHSELPLLFADIGNDPENRVVILTGTGDVFCTEIQAGEWDFSTPAGWDKTYLEGRRLIQNLLDIHVPMIAAVNGPARVHAEILVLCDIVLMSETADFQDAAHFGDPWKVVPGDGSHLVWPLLLGPNRGKYFLLMQQILDASESLALGVANEVLAPEALMPRAREVARHLAERSTVSLRNTRVVLNMMMRNMMQDSMSHGLALEGYSVMHNALEAAREAASEES
ncbi:MAG: enoyl-CoA hydratase/isomerase family protein [Deltaproteobacteria bacterium]|nr:enoyl-CoA hydratase/isomerase family protein [Deltaproteobacteria bacterium]